jgi:hypothetical protein
MQEAVIKNQEAIPAMEYGRVDKHGEKLAVQTRFGLHPAKRAVSCLVRPENGDRVIASLDNNGECFILSVLERTAPVEGMDLDFEGNVNLRVNSGALRLLTDEELQLAAGSDLFLTGRRLGINAQSAETRVERFSFWGRLMNLRLETMEFTARGLTQNIRRLTQWLTQSFRSVEEHDEVQAGSARYLVDDTLTVQSGNEIHMAEEDVKIDAEQIHLG